MKYVRFLLVCPIALFVFIAFMSIFSSLVSLTGKYYVLGGIATWVKGIFSIYLSFAAAHLVAPKFTIGVRLIIALTLIISTFPIAIEAYGHWSGALKEPMIGMFTSLSPKWETTLLAASTTFMIMALTFFTEE